MTESQLSICTWADATFGPASDASIAARALVEMAELVTACVNGEPAERIGEEIADVVIVLARLGRSVGVDVIQKMHDVEPDADPDYSITIHALRAMSALAELVTATDLRDRRWTEGLLTDAIGSLVDLVERVASERVARVEFDIPSAIDAKMASNRARRWTLDGHGHGSHVKDGAS